MAACIDMDWKRERGRIRACDRKCARDRIRAVGKPAWGWKRQRNVSGKNGAGKFSCGRWDGAVSAAAVVAVFCREGGRSPAGQSFFRGLENEKLRIYEADGDSIRQAALEIYRESKDSGWTGSWTERYRVSRVCTKGQYVSVLLDSDLKEGNLKKIPHRESYVLDLESGQQVTLEKLLGKSREKCYQLLQEAYRDKLRENPGVYYADAEEKIAALNPEKIGWYFTETAIVCYLEPYTIALPEEGYVEAELPIEDDRE